MKRNRYSAARKGIWYILKIVLSFVAIVVLCIAALFEGMNISNIYIIVTEGLTQRAECVLQDGATDELYEYFTAAFIESDPRLLDDLYADYTVTAYDYRFEFKSLRVLPWGGSATVTGIERMAGISGSINETAIPADAEEGATYPMPEWGTALVEIRFTQDNGRWYVSQINILEEDPAEAVKPTPDMSLLDEPQ